MNKGTYKGDVYSFAIVMQEVISRSAPFCTLDMPAKGLSHAYTFAQFFFFRSGFKNRHSHKAVVKSVQVFMVSM